MRSKHFRLGSSWQIVLRDLEVDLTALTGLPSPWRGAAVLTPEEFYLVWEQLEAQLGPLTPLRLVQATSTESLTPLLLAALSSPNLLVALDRIALYKRLLAPIAMELDFDEGGGDLQVGVRWIAGPPPPPSFAIFELVFFVALVRIATRSRIVPISVCVRTPPLQMEAYAAYLGVEIEVGGHHQLIFEREAALRPFLTANAAIWRTFEPMLSGQILQLDTTSTMEARVRSVLLESLPSGVVSIDTVARRLAVSKRTLQRRLKAEGTSFQAILHRTRELLALHYLRHSELSSSEIALLLGFGETSSFYRAFQAWTGTTPEAIRLAKRPMT